MHQPPAPEIPGAGGFFLLLRYQTQLIVAETCFSGGVHRGCLRRRVNEHLLTAGSALQDETALPGAARGVPAPQVATELPDAAQGAVAQTDAALRGVAALQVYAAHRDSPGGTALPACAAHRDFPGGTALTGAAAHRDFPDGAALPACAAHHDFPGGSGAADAWPVCARHCCGAVYARPRNGDAADAGDSHDAEDGDRDDARAGNGAAHSHNAHARGSASGRSTTMRAPSSAPGTLP